MKLIASRYSNQTFLPTIVAPGGTSTLAAAACKKLGINFSESVSDEEFSRIDLIVVLDAGELGLLGDFADRVQQSKASKVVIDHHRKQLSDQREQWQEFDFVLVNPSATSTSEIIVNETDPELMDKTAADSLLVGLMFDSQHLGIANESTLKACLTLVQKGARIEEAKSVLRGVPERSEVIARLKSAQRLSFKEIGSYFFAQSGVSSFHAAVARMLLDIGADVGIAYGESGGESRISLRSTQRFYRETAIDLAALIADIGNNFEVLAGGHPTAASMSGRFDPKKTVEAIFEKAKTALPIK